MPSCLTSASVRILTFLTTFVCFFFLVSCGGNPSPTTDPDVSFTNELPIHSLEQRKQDLVDLLIELEHGRTLKKSDVESRMGKPDSIDTTGSKVCPDRVLLTYYRYDVPSGDYTLPNSQKISFDSGGWADITFEERMTHPNGRLWAIRDDTAPVCLFKFKDASDERHYITLKCGPTPPRVGD
jgi:hypothetical protein